MGYRIEDINLCDEARFVELLGGVFEHSPWIAAQVFSRRPFASRQELHEAMSAAARRAGREQCIALLRAHPELAGREARAGDLTRESRREQAGAGLDQCTAVELGKIESLNRAYREKFGFPFIIAVAGLDKLQILAEMARRLGNTAEVEFATALAEVEKIARIRIAALIDG